MRPNNTKHFLTGKNLFSAPFTFLYSYFLLLSLFTFSFLLFNSCNTTEPGSSPRITLNFEDASSTEVWLNLHAGVDLLADVKIYKDNKLSRTINLISKDTVIYEDNLLPQKSYTFRASAKLGDIELQSQNVTAVTMDTTSHNFTWQTYTFGGANGSSVLNDVAIINENDIWVVGEIHTAETDQFDSNGVWVQPYNAVHWDGSSWELKRILVNFRGNMIFIPLEGIFAFASDDIWLVGSLPIHGDGENWKIYDVREITNSDLSLTNAWGINSNDIYFVGRGGSIAHYNGSTWTKIESGTKTQIRDIWGYCDELTKKRKIICAVSNVITLGDNKLLEINDDNTITEISWDTGYIDKRVNSIWFNNKVQIFTCGGGVFISKKKGLWAKQPLPSIHTNKIRGKEINDVFVAGDFGLIAHFNGFSWKVYSEANVALFYSLDYKKNILIAVGERNAKGVLLMMRKQ